jgi:hypothetical protein
MANRLSGYVTTVRDGYFLSPLQTARCAHVAMGWKARFADEGSKRYH